MKEVVIEQLPELPFNVEESLNQLRINLSFCGEGIKVIMITSSVPNEGKSFVAQNLWRMFAGLGMKTLLIDADLRNSEMRSKLDMHLKDNSKMQGIAYYLSGQCEMNDCLYQTNLENAFILPTTTNVVNPIIMLEGERFAQMIEVSRKVFDYIIVDTPPLQSVADALTISKNCDGTVLTVRSGDTPRKMVANSVQLLRRTEVPLLGVCLNRVDAGKRSGKYYGKYYSKGYYYSSYGTDKNDSKKEKFEKVRKPK